VLLGLFLALGSYNPLLSYIMHAVPALRLMQYPVKFLLLSSFALAIMSGFGVDTFFARMRERSSLRGILKPLLLPCCILFALLLSAAAARTQLFELFVRVYPASDYFAPLRDARFFDFYRGAFFAALLFGGFAALTWCTIRLKQKPILPAVLFTGILCADLFLLGAPGDSWLDRQEVLRPSPVIKTLQQDNSLYRIYSMSRIAGGISYSHTPHLSFDRVYRVLAEALPPNLHIYHGLASVDEYSELLTVRYYEIFGRALLHLAERTNDPEGNKYCRKIFSMLNVKYVISPRPLPELEFELIQNGPIKIYKNKNVWPRAFMAAKLIVCPDDTAVLDKIHQANFEPRTVFVPQAELDRLPADLQTALLAQSSDYSAQTVTVVSQKPNRVELRVHTKKHGLVTLSDTWFPGWRVRVNGSESQLLRVNHTLRAVALKPGVSRVEFVYRPAAFSAGLLLSALTVCILAVIALAGCRRASIGSTTCPDNKE